MKGREWWAEYKAYVYVALAVCVLSWMGVHGLRALGVVLLIGGVVVLTGWGKWNKMAQVYLTGPGEVMEPSEREDATMPKHRADAVVTYPGKPMVVVSVATTPSKIVLSFGDGREWHGTYPADGRFHLTEDASSSHSFLEPGPSLSDISYVHVVSVPSRWTRRNSSENSGPPAETRSSSRRQLNEKARWRWGYSVSGPLLRSCSPSRDPALRRSFRGLGRTPQSFCGTYRRR